MKIKMKVDSSNLDDNINLNIGKVITILSKVNTGGNVNLDFVFDLVVPATLHEQIAFFYDIKNEPIGFVTWCKLSRKTSDMFIKYLNFKLHLSEWNEGDQIWINSFYCTRQSLRGICKKFLNGEVIASETVMFRHSNSIKMISNH
jgi:cytolysin-activating lysine-acyltransferase